MADEMDIVDFDKLNQINTRPETTQNDEPCSREESEENPNEGELFTPPLQVLMSKFIDSF